MSEQYVANKLKTSFSVKGVYTIHYFKYGKNFNIQGESHDFWEMVYIDSGKATLISENKTFELKQGEAYFHRPNEFHNILTKEEFARSAILSFNCPSRSMSFFKDKIFTFSAYEKDLLNRIIVEGNKCFEDKLDDIYLKKMNKRKAAPFGSEQLIKNYIEILLISLARNNIKSGGSKDVTENLSSLQTEAIAEKIKDFLVKNVYGEVSLEQLADELFFSKTYIKAVFKKNTGLSIIQYYITLKIDEAKKLISQNKFSFTEISDMLDFNSVHYFSRLFKKRVGLTPSEYAKSIKVDNLI